LRGNSQEKKIEKSCPTSWHHLGLTAISLPFAPNKKPPASKEASGLKKFIPLRSQAMLDLKVTEHHGCTTGDTVRT
jgi:hypothetical protein